MKKIKIFFLVLLLTTAIGAKLNIKDISASDAGVQITLQDNAGYWIEF